MPESFPVLDTHTGGEITRVILAADVGLQGNSAAEHLEQLRNELDWVRRCLTGEPRGSEYAVGAFVSPPGTSGTPAVGTSSNTETPPGGAADNRHGTIVFFNNVGYLGMCGHGLIGVVEALRYRGHIGPGNYCFETPAGRVRATLEPDRQVRFTGVPSECYRSDVEVELQGAGRVVGDIAYGGNWFFLAPDPAVADRRVSELMEKTLQIRQALQRHGISGRDEAEIDHVELYAPLQPTMGNDGQPRIEVGCRNFVLCPGGHYDRSPCGTGTSAKLACLAKRNELAPDAPWIQESITGSRFVASFRTDGDRIRAQITGRAHVIAETRQVFDPDDSLGLGIGGGDR